VRNPNLTLCALGELSGSCACTTSAPACQPEHSAHLGSFQYCPAADGVGLLCISQLVRPQIRVVGEARPQSIPGCAHAAPCCAKALRSAAACQVRYCLLRVPSIENTAIPPFLYNTPPLDTHLARTQPADCTVATSQGFLTRCVSAPPACSIPGKHSP
jgi:hypothetical protein